MAAGDDHVGRRAATIAVIDRGGRGDVVVDVGVESGENSSSLQRPNGAMSGIKTQTVLPSADTAAMLFWLCLRPAKS